MLHSKTGDINFQAQTQRLCGFQHRRMGEMEGDVDCYSAWMSGTLGKGCLSLVGFPRVHLQVLGRLLRRCVEPEQVTAMSSFPLRPPESLVGRKKENGQGRREKGDSKHFGDGPQSQGQVYGRKGTFTECFLYAGSYWCIIPQEFLANLSIFIVAEYFYSHCTEEDTETGTGTGHDLTTKSGVFAGQLDGWVLKSDPSGTHSTTTARPGLLPFPAPVSRGRLCCVWLERLGAEVGTWLRNRKEEVSFKGSWIWGPLSNASVMAEG